MNNIYKVIWSKAKNCYVVASEIARSHTKSASGSEKIGGGTRRKLLASLMALSLLCGGLGVAEASVHVNEAAGGTSEVYTTDETYKQAEVNAKLELKADATDVATNTANITKNNENITKLENNKLDKALASETYATKDALRDLKDTVNGKADATTVTTALGDKANTDLSNLTTAGETKIKETMSADMEKKANKDTVTALVGRVGGLETTIGTKANQNDLADATNRITANEGNITALQKKTAKLSDDGKELTGMTTVSGTTVSGTNVEANALKVTGEISNGAGVTTTLTDINDSMTQTATNKGDIAALQTKTGEQQTAIDDLKKRTTKIDYDTATDTTSVNGMKVGQQVDMGGKNLTNVGTINGIDLGTKEGGNYISQDGSIWGNMKTVDTQVKTNADNIETNKNAITTLDTKVGEIDDRTGGIKRNTEDTQTTIEGKVTVDNSGNVGGVKGLSAETINTTGNATISGALNVTGESSLKNTTVDGTLTAKGEATFKEKVTMEKDLEVKGELKTDKIAMENKKTDADGRHNSSTTITADYITHIGEVEKSGVTTKSSFTHNEEGSETYAMKGDKTDWTETRSDVKADGVKTEVKDSKGNRTNTSQTADGIKGYATDEKGNKTYTKVTATENSFQVQDKDGKNKNHQVNTKDSSVTEITNGDGKTTKTEQTATDIINTAKDGTIKNEANHIENTATTMKTTVTGQATEEFNGGLDTTVTGTENHTVNGKQINTIKNGQENIISGGQTNTITGGQTNNITGDQTTTITGNKKETVTENVTEDYQKDLTTTVGGNENHAVKGTKTETVEGKVTENFKGGQETNVTGDKKTTVTGKTTEEYKGGLETTVTGDERHTVTGNQTTTVTGDISNTAKNITNEASNSIIDKVGDHTRVLDSDGITDTVGGSTFKQRIDKIMMESKDVSIKAEETLTNEAKVITNKASEVINNEAVNINNTATGIITSKASEIKNQADKLISNKVGENTWENMENGKITTSIKDGAKQNLTQSNAAETKQSTVDGAKSTVTIQNADGLTGAVTDGRNISVQNQTASAIATDVEDGAGNKNASVANATTSANTITNGTKTNTVISTVDGTSFINSEANTAFEGGTYTDTTIKGNTITTGKVKMDYAEVMRDLGVHGNAKVDQNLEVGGTSTLKGDVTMESNATVKKNLTVGGNANITGDVTAKSYKVGDKTYISADGINANNQKITNVADGSISEGSKDAVNGGQLYGVKRDLEHQVDKVGANAAAMANLRPMEFDPSSKWNIAAAIGNYGSETAAALGAFYRPNDNVMVNLSTAFGTGENMVGGGVSVRLGKGGNKLSREETNALKAQVADLTARMDALLSVLNPNMSKDFPDVPENHWAYEAVSRLAGNDIVQGYPDGEFHGERTMTRYEMAEIIYNALSRGAEAERELVEEFKPELQAMAASEKSTAEKAEG